MMHAFSLTDNYVLVYDLPVTFDMDKIANSSATAPASTFPYSWNPEYPSRLGVMPRTGGSEDVRWFDVEPCYVYHPLNAYDEEDRIVIDVTRHPKTFATEHRGPNEGAPTLDRWTVDLTSGKVLEERLDDRGQEFPRMDERLIGRRHRFGYSIGFGSSENDDVSHQLFKHDLVSGRSTTKSFGPKSELDEFVFVPTGPDSSEDEGVLMGFVYSGETDSTDLVMLDAATLETAAVTHLPVRVPHGFHGNFVAG